MRVARRRRRIGRDISNDFLLANSLFQGGLNIPSDHFVFESMGKIIEKLNKTAYCHINSIKIVSVLRRDIPFYHHDYIETCPVCHGYMLHGQPCLELKVINSYEVDEKNYYLSYAHQKCWKEFDYKLKAEGKKIATAKRERKSKRRLV